MPGLCATVTLPIHLDYNKKPGCSFNVLLKQPGCFSVWAYSGKPEPHPGEEAHVMLEQQFPLP